MNRKEKKRMLTEVIKHARKSLAPLAPLKPNSQTVIQSKK